MQSDPHSWHVCHMIIIQPHIYYTHEMQLQCQFRPCHVLHYQLGNAEDRIGSTRKAKKVKPETGRGKWNWRLSPKVANKQLYRAPLKESFSLENAGKPLKKRGRPSMSFDLLQVLITKNSNHGSWCHQNSRQGTAFAKKHVKKSQSKREPFEKWGWSSSGSSNPSSSMHHTS